MHDLNDLVKLLDGDVNVQKQVIQSIQPKNEPFEFRFNGHANSLTNTEINSFSKALAKLDYTRILTLTHQKDFISTDVLATLVESSRCLRQLDISYGDILDFSQLFQAINSDDDDDKDVANQKGDLDSDEEQKCLQSLNISGNHLKFDDAKLLGSQLEKNTSLLALRLKSCSMKIDSIIRIIEGLYKNNTLESLDLSRQDRSVDPYNLSCHIQKYFFNNVSTITRLNLRHLNLTDQCVFNITTGLLNGSNSLKHLDVSNNMLSRDSAKSFVKLLNGHPLETLNISYNRLENEGLIEILNCLDANDNSVSCSNALSVLIAKTVEASGDAWSIAKKILSAKNATLREFYIWGNCFKNQIGAAAIKYLIDERRYRSGRNIDVQPYVVDDVIWMAENGDSGRVAEDSFHEILDSDHY